MHMKLLPIFGAVVLSIASPVFAGTSNDVWARRESRVEEQSGLGREYLRDYTDAALVLAFLVIIALVWLLAFNKKTGSMQALPGASMPGPPPPPSPSGATPEFCPCHGVPLINGECPHGCTITRCTVCGAIMKNGVCPNGCREPETCPSCGSRLLPEGYCPHGCTIIRCSNCGKILDDGVCPNGCNAAPLHFGWPGAQRPPMTDFALEIVSPAEYAGFRTDIPTNFVIGRSAKDAREPFLELLVLDLAKKAACSRRYVELALVDENKGFEVKMLKNHNFATVCGHRISDKGECGLLVPGGTLKLNPNFELKLVRKTSASGASSNVGSQPSTTTGR